MLCVFHFVAGKTRITTINRYAFVERAQKSGFLSDLYQIFSFFSKTIRSDQIFKYSWKHPNIWSDQIRSESDHKFCLMPNPVADATCCYICKKINSNSLRRWQSKTGCSTCRNYFNRTFDSAYKAINEIQIDNIEQDISDENGKVMSIFWKSIDSNIDCVRFLNCEDFSKLCIHKER